MDWFARPKRKERKSERKQRSDKGSSKRKATDARFDGMPEYVDMKDVDDL
jgi:hypothetical protein